MSQFIEVARQAHDEIAQENSLRRETLGKVLVVSALALLPEGQDIVPLAHPASKLAIMVFLWLTATSMPTRASACCKVDPALVWDPEPAGSETCSSPSKSAFPW